MVHRSPAQYFSIIVLLAFAVACSDNESSVAKLQAAGQKAFLGGRYGQARQYFMKALAQKPSDRNLLFFTGLSFKRDYLYDSALIYLKRADILYSGDREINLELFEAAMVAKNYPFAINAIHILNKTGDPESKHLGQLIELYAATEDPMNVVFFARKAIKIYPDSVTFYMQLVGALIAVDSLETATSMADSAVARFGERNELTALKGNISAYRGNYQAAEKIFRSLISAAPFEAHRYKMNLANVLSMQKDPAKRTEALSLYREIKDKFGPQFKIDSLIQALETERK